jgi:predicted ester cyclase
MPADSNTTLVIAKIEEGWNARRLAVFDELCASSMVDHSVPPGLPQTRDGTKKLAALYWTAFPNLRLTIEDQIADSDTVLTRWTARGTHTGELMGLAPTGKPVIVTGISIDRLVADKIVGTWGEIDLSPGPTDS